MFAFICLCILVHLSVGRDVLQGLSFGMEGGHIVSLLDSFAKFRPEKVVQRTRMVADPSFPNNNASSCSNTSWCVLSANNTIFRTNPAHSLPALAPCWSWLLAISRQRPLMQCGFALVGGVEIENRWAASLVRAMGCALRRGAPRPCEAQVHLTGLGSGTHERGVDYFASPHDALLLKERLWAAGGGETPAAALAQDKAQLLGDDPLTLRVKIVQRQRSRALANLTEALQALLFSAAAGDVAVSLARFEGLALAQQVEYARDAHVLLLAHGAAMVNALFVRPCAAVCELFPRRYFPRGFFQFLALDAGALACHFSADRAPHADFDTRKRSAYKQAAVAISAEEALALLAEARRRRERCLREFSLRDIFPPAD
eukprot:gene37129-45070_t